MTESSKPGPSSTGPSESDPLRTEESGQHAARASASDAELIAATRLSDAGAYGILYQRHAAAAGRLARQIVGNSADADDVVAETFARVLGAIRRGAGPSEAFRPYLLTAVRRVAFGQLRGQRDQVPTDSAELPDPGEPFVDPVIARLERSLVTQAFLSLPERWSAVLWHTEIERAMPAEVALLLGISPNSVSALSYRAREGLRQAYLQMHLSDRTRVECRPVAGKLGAYVRGRLSRRDARQVDTHLTGCRDCMTARAELVSVNGSLNGVVAPLILGSYASGYLASGGPIAQAAGISSAVRGLRTMMVHRHLVPVAIGLVATAIAIPAATVILPHLGTPHTFVPFGFAPGSSGSKSGGSSRPQGPSPSEPVSAPTPTPTSSGAQPGGSPAPSPTLPALPPPGTTPTPGATPTIAAKLSVRVRVTGLLDLGAVTVVDVAVSDQGGAATGRLTADLTLPSGLVLLGLAGSATWSCTTSSAGATSCTHAAIAAGVTSLLAVKILVATLSGCGSPVGVTVTSGSLSAAAESAAKLQCTAPLL
ncbi:MAG TPA: sigma-70 family RNA polymerase sigma factor [Streptosporangiaceae bacterium]|nr:sigma-70 family RNA polymerase sigma factor [Streptosporangiaceae bacterium]